MIRSFIYFSTKNLTHTNRDKIHNLVSALTNAASKKLQRLNYDKDRGKDDGRDQKRILPPFVKHRHLGFLQEKEIRFTLNLPVLSNLDYHSTCCVKLGLDKKHCFQK